MPSPPGTWATPRRGDLVRWQVRDVAPVEHDRAVIGLGDPTDRTQQGRLAGSVRADESHDLALTDLDRNVREDGHAVVADLELADGQEGQLAVAAVTQHLGPGAHGGPDVADVLADQAAGARHDQAADGEDRDQDQQPVAEADGIADGADDREHEQSGQDEQCADGEADGADTGRNGE